MRRIASIYIRRMQPTRAIGVQSAIVEQPLIKLTPVLVRYRETIPDCLVNGVGYLARDIDLPTPIRASAPSPPRHPLPLLTVSIPADLCPRSAITDTLILNERAN